jgi:hypothetical protein
MKSHDGLHHEIARRVHEHLVPRDAEALGHRRQKTDQVFAVEQRPAHRFGGKAVFLL